MLRLKHESMKINVKQAVKVQEPTKTEINTKNIGKMQIPQEKE